MTLAGVVSSSGAALKHLEGIRQSTTTQSGGNVVKAKVSSQQILLRCNSPAVNASLLRQGAGITERRRLRLWLCDLRAVALPVNAIYCFPQLPSQSKSLCCSHMVETAPRNANLSTSTVSSYFEGLSVIVVGHFWILTAGGRH